MTTASKNFLVSYPVLCIFTQRCWYLESVTFIHKKRRPRLTCEARNFHLGFLGRLVLKFKVLMRILPSQFNIWVCHANDKTADTKFLGNVQNVAGTSCEVTIKIIRGLAVTLLKRLTQIQKSWTLTKKTYPLSDDSSACPHEKSSQLVLRSPKYTRK